MSDLAPADTLDSVLERAERTVAKLSDARLPLEQLVNAYEEAGRLARDAEARLAALQLRAGS